MAISIIIPTFNSSRFLAFTLDSVAKQERPPDEVIIVDDMSVDQTLDIVRSWAAEQSFPVTVLTNKYPKPNLPGPAGGRQTGLEHASTDMIALLDHDDLMLPSHLRLMELALTAQPGINLCFADALEFQEEQRSEKSFFKGKSIETVRHGESSVPGLRVIEEPLFNTLLQGSYIPTASNLFLREAALKAGGFRPLAGSCDDVLFFICLSRIGSSAYYPFPLAKKRSHSENLSHGKYTLQSCWSYLAVLRYLREYGAEQLNLTAPDLARIDERLNLLQDEILYHASRSGMSVFLKTRAELKSRMGKDFVRAALRATLRSSRLILNRTIF